MLSDKELSAKLRANAKAGRRSTITPETALRLAKALDHQPTWPDELGFKVEAWDADGHLYRTEARCSDVIIGRAAFEAATARPSNHELTLKKGAHLIASVPPRK